MAARFVSIELAPLLRPELTPCTKLVAIGLQIDQHLDEKLLRSPSRLRRRLGPSRTTIRKALDILATAYSELVPPGLSQLFHLKVAVPEELITDKSIPATARVLYCILCGLRQLGMYKTLSSFAGIAEVVGVQARTVRQAVLHLVQAGWLAISQKHKHAPIRFSFPDPVKARQQAERRRAEQVLAKNQVIGETLARVWCDTLVDSNSYHDDCYPEFLINPDTNQLLQADRYYPDHKVIIEFQGPQHDGATERFSEAEAEAQMKRDNIKREICRRLKIPLIELRPEDLRLKRLRKLLGKVLPLKARSKDEPVIRFLEEESRKYQVAIRSIRRRSGQVL